MMEVKNLKLIVAAHEGKIVDIRKLLSKGADINSQDVQGRTALHYASSEDHTEVVKLLLENGGEFIEDGDGKTPFDFISTNKRQELLTSFGKNILKTSLNILANCKIQDRNPSHNFYAFEIIKSVEALSKRFESIAVNDKVSYEQTNAIILALEFFSVYKDMTVQEIVYVTQDDINKVINSYNFDSERKCKAEFLVITMKQWIGNLQTQISNGSFFSLDKDLLISTCNDGQSFLSGLNQNVDNTIDPMDKLKNLVFETYSENDKERLEQRWFEFIVDIYPSLKIEEKSDEDLSEMENQIKQLKNNLLHEFHHFGIEEFLDAIRKLRSRLFEFYYSKNVTDRLVVLIPETDSKEIVKILNNEVDIVQYNLGLCEDDLLFGTEVEGINLVDVKFIESMYPKVLFKNQNATLTELVQEYFKFMPLLEDLNLDTTTLCQELRFESGCEYTQVGAKNKKVYEFLSDIEKKSLFEKFMKLKMIKKHCSDRVYEVEKLILEQELSNYNVSQAKFRQVCKHYLEDDGDFNEEINRIIDNTVLFIRKLSSIKETEKNCSRMQIDHLGEIILQNYQSKMFNSSEYTAFRNKLESRNQNYIKQAFYLSDFLHIISIPVGDIFFEIDVKKTVINMLKTFCNAFNEYKIELDVEKIFIRETFLNELVPQIAKNIACFKNILGENYGILNSHIFMIIQKLLKIEFLSPLVVRILEVVTKEQIFRSPPIDADHLLSLIDILGRNYITYLGILLKIKNLKLYDQLFYIILEKGFDIENIKTLFNEFCHIDAMANVLLSQDFDENKKDIIINTAKTFIKLMNEEIFKRYNSKQFDDALYIIKISKEIEEKFKNMIEINFECYIDRDILMARIKNDKEDNTTALYILTELRTRLSDNLCHKSKYLIILSDLAYTYKLINDDKMQKAGEIYRILYNEIIKHVLCLDDGNENFNVFKTFKEKYTQIENLQSYKNLLSSSEILNSKTYLRIETIVEECAYINMRCGKKDLDLLHWYKDCINIYRGNYLTLKAKGKHAQSIQEIRMMASMKSSLAKMNQDFGNNSDALYYYLWALDDINKIYFEIKQIYGENHLRFTKILYKIKTGAYYLACGFQKVGEYKLSLNVFIDLLGYEKQNDKNFKHIQGIICRIKTLCKLTGSPIPKICY